MKNKSVIDTPLNSAALLPTSGNRARNTLSQLAANHVSPPSAQLQHRLWSGIAVTIVTIAATRSSCHQTPLSRGVTQKCLLRLGTNTIISELVAATINNTNIIEFIFCNLRQTKFKILCYLYESYDFYCL